MSAPSHDYAKIFSRLCHLSALTMNGRTGAAVDSLVLNVLALDSGLTPRNASEIAEAIHAYFSISVSENMIQSTLDRQLTSGELLWATGSRIISLSPHTRAEIEGRIADAHSLEGQVKDQWLDAIPGIDPGWREQLWSCLRAYMAKTFHRHGAETIMLLSPGTPVNGDVGRSLTQFLTESIANNCGPECASYAESAIHLFFKTTTSQRTKYLAQLLDGTFTFFALSVDSVTSSYLKQSLGPISLFLDTNFIFGILGLHANPLVDVSQELLSFIKSNAFPFKIYYHEETLREIQSTISSIGARLQARQWSVALSRAAVRNGQLSGLEVRYHQQNVETPTSPATFLTKYSYVPALLESHGIKIYRDTAHGSDYSERKLELVNQYRLYLEKYRPNRPKAFVVMEHDIAVWLTINSLRTRATSVLNVTALLLTTDYYLRRFDWQELRSDGTVGSVVLPNHFLQLLRPFVPSTDDFDARFVETFAIPEFRTSGSDYSFTVSKILSLLATFRDVSEETAVKILANDMLIRDLEGVDEDTDEFREAIESALLEENQQLIEEKEALIREAAHAKESAALSNERVQAQAEEVSRVFEQLQAAVVKTSAAEQEAAQLRQRDQEREAREQGNETKLNALQVRIENIIHGVIGAVVAVIGVTAIILIPDLTSWSWLANHPNRLGLYICATIIVLGLASAIVIRGWKARWGLFVGVIFAALLVIAQIIGP